MEKKSPKETMKILSIIYAIVIFIIVGGFLIVHSHNKSQIFEGDGSKHLNSVLFGRWTEIDSLDSDLPTTCEIKENAFYYYRKEKMNHCSYTVTEGETYSLNIEDAMSISFLQGEGPWYGDLVYHTQKVNGHTVRILTAFMFEEDGRGLMVSTEFIHNDDLAYIDSDFHSDIYHRLNDRNAPPSYIEDDEAD